MKKRFGNWLLVINWWSVALFLPGLSMLVGYLLDYNISPILVLLFLILPNLLASVMLSLVNYSRYWNTLKDEY